MKSILLFYHLVYVFFFFLYFVKPPGNIEFKNLTRIFILLDNFFHSFLYFYIAILYFYIYCQDDTILLLLLGFQNIYYASQDIYFIERV